MTADERIHVACSQAQLRQSPQKYIALLERYQDKELNTEQRMMFEDLYLVGGIVERYHVKKEYKTNEGTESCYYDVRYTVDTKIKECQECRQCERLKAQLHELENLLQQKIRYQEAG